MLIVFVVFLQSILFAIFHLHIRKLEEKGVSAHAIAGLQRYSLIPAIVLFAFAYKQEYVSMLFADPNSIWWIAGIAFFWGIGQFFTYLILDSASSLSFVYTLSSFLGIPIMLGAGILINGDYPNAYILIALALLVLALILKPSQHKNNVRRLLKYSAIITAGIVFTNSIAHALNGAFYKNILHLLDSSGSFFGISLYILISSIVINIIYLLPIFKKPSAEEKSIIKKYSWVAYSIPFLWLLASLPEGYSFAHIPLFTISALGAFSFLIKLASDLKNKRLAWNAHTAIFTLVVILSIIFSALSLK